MPKQLQHLFEFGRFRVDRTERLLFQDGVPLSSSQALRHASDPGGEPEPRGGEGRPPNAKDMGAQPPKNGPPSRRQLQPG